MRLLIDSLIALMLLAVLGGVLVYHRHQEESAVEHQKVHRALADLQEAALLKGAMGDVETNDVGFPLDVMPVWFNGALPINSAVPERQPWLDIAPEGDKSDHPPDPVIRGGKQAGFWYNPNRGLFRARVTPQFTEEDTLELYNQLNNCNLRELPRKDAAPRFAPRPAGSVLAAKDASESPAAGTASRPSTLRDPSPTAGVSVTP
jgi:hypothetical protein